MKHRRLVVYRFDATDRASPPADQIIELQPVPDSIRDGNDYVAIEVELSFSGDRHQALQCLALLEIESLAVLHFHALVANASGMVFLNDPATSHGILPNAPDGDLNDARTSMELTNLLPVEHGQQPLDGRRVRLIGFETDESELPVPSAPAPYAFTFLPSDTYGFAAVNAYFHCNRFFELIDALGFSPSFFGDTRFPVLVCFMTNSSSTGASCYGSAFAIGTVNFGIVAGTRPGIRIGNAADWRVTLHELGGHGVLYCHVNHSQMMFSHSAGDSVAAILCDPETVLTGRDRYKTWPFHEFDGRRHDRRVSEGWAWGGRYDTGLIGGGYDPEQILSTTLFRLYCAVGGDSTNPAERTRAARLVVWLIFKAIENLTPTSNPRRAIAFEGQLEAADRVDWAPLEPRGTLFGGAYGKVIRWAFEKQGMFQPGYMLPPGLIDTAPVTTPGAPPSVDVYINDGRAGEYGFYPNYWSRAEIWNRWRDDDGRSHQAPIVGRRNYAYVRIKNRGAEEAINVIVRGYHAAPGGIGLAFPGDFYPMATRLIRVASIPGDERDGIVIGPFSWWPASFYDCVLFIASAEADPSNADRFTNTRPIPTARLVPNDNNVGMLNVHAFPPDNLRALIMGSLPLPIWVRNPFPYDAGMELLAELPAWLSKAGWRVEFDSGRAFKLRRHGKKQVMVRFRPHPSSSYEVLKPKGNLLIELRATASGVGVGGMTFVRAMK